MGFVESVKTCLRKYVDFKGRAPRSEYWWFILFSLIVGIVSSFMDLLLFPGVSLDANQEFGSGFINAVTSLAMLIPSISALVRRLHDINRSGWYAAVFYLGPLCLSLMVGFSVVFGNAEPPVGAVIALVIGIIGIMILWFIFAITKGTIGDNKYGPDPLAGMHKEETGPTE